MRRADIYVALALLVIPLGCAENQSMHGWTTGKVGYDNGGARSLWMFRFGLQDGVPHLSKAIAPF